MGNGGGGYVLAQVAWIISPGIPSPSSAPSLFLEPATQCHSQPLLIPAYPPCPTCKPCQLCLWNCPKSAPSFLLTSDSPENVISLPLASRCPHLLLQLLFKLSISISWSTNLFSLLLYIHYKSFQNLSVPSKVTLFIIVPVSHGNASYTTPSLVPLSNYMRLYAGFLNPLPICSLLGTISLSSRSNSRGWGCSSVGQMLAWHVPHILRMLTHAYMPSTRELEAGKSEVQDKPQLDEFEANQGYSEALSQKGKKGGGKEWGRKRRWK